MKKIYIFTAILIFLLLCVLAWIYRDILISHNSKQFTLYGNVEDRQINLAFQLPERINSIEAEEGTNVKKGQLLATLDTERIVNNVKAAEASLKEAEANLLKLKNGSRKEDIEIARATLNGAQANLEMRTNDYIRQQKLEKTSSVSIQISEKAESDYRIAEAAVSAAKSNLEKLIAGSRVEDIEAGEAKIAQAKAQLAIQEQMLKDTKLYSPCDGIVRKRLMEAGEMANPQTPVLSIAVTSPKWVRAYLPETMLTKIKNADKALIQVDGMPENKFEGWVGFISPVAEFTPKNVETPELRASLVYEVRIIVKDPQNLLKLGCPATVIFPEISAK